MSDRLPINKCLGYIQAAWCLVQLLWVVKLYTDPHADPMASTSVLLNSTGEQDVQGTLHPNTTFLASKSQHNRADIMVIIAFFHHSRGWGSLP